MGFIHFASTLFSPDTQIMLQKPKAKAGVSGKKHLGDVLAKVVAALKSKQHPAAGHIYIFVVSIRLSGCLVGCKA